MEKVIKELQKVLENNQILCDEPMSRHTTFRTGGNADLLLQPRTEQLADVLAIVKKEQIPITIIGNGSNLLVGDKGIRGVVIEIGKQMQGFREENGLLCVAAGVLLSQAAAEAYQKGLSGLEFAAGIPGTVGGAMVMNAGAYGGEMKDVVEFVKVLTNDGEIKTLSNAEMEFGYRRSCITEKDCLVIEAAFRLEPSEKEPIKKRMDELREQRVSKQPLEYPSAGSTFKRPEGYFAGKLIMDAGLAGYTVGGAKVSEKHCGFVVNSNHATSKDVRDVIAHVQKTVYEAYGVKLETEVKMLGEF